MRERFVFATATLVITLSFVSFDQFAKNKLSDRPFIEQELSHLRHQEKENTLKEKVLQNELAEYRAQVYRVLEANAGSIKTWEQKNLLAVTRFPASVEPMDQSGLVFAQAQSKFRDREFGDAESLFESFVANYPTSEKVMEARFLRTESLFLAGKYDESLQEIESMMQQYPDHPTTGYLMLRLSQLLQMRHRKPEALEVLSMVRTHFPQESGLLEQAQRLSEKYQTL